MPDSPTTPTQPDRPGPEDPSDEAVVRRWVAALDEDALLALLGARPDLTWGAAPADLADLAERLTHPAFLLEALQDLDVPSSLVLNAVTMLGWGATPGRLTEVFDAGDANPGALEERLRGVLAGLRSRGLVLPRPGAGEVLVAVPGLDAVVAPLLPGVPLRSLLAQVPVDELLRALRSWGTRPASSARAHVVTLLRTALSDPGHVQRVLAGADEEIRDALHRLVVRLVDERDDPFPGYDPQRVADLQRQFAATRWAVDHGLLVGGASSFAPAFATEVLLALVRGRLRLPLPTRPPAPATVEVSADLSHRASAGALTDATSVAMGVLEHVARTPLPARKDGCVGAREVTRLAKALAADVPLVRWSLETAARRGLLVPGEDGPRGGFTVSGTFEAWRRTAPGARCADLLTTWRDVDTLLVRERDLDDKPAAVLGVPTALRVPVVRRVLLRALADLPPGRGIVSAEELFEHAGWSSPHVLDTGDATIAGDVLAEAELLGVVASGRLTDVGSALLGGDRDALVAAATAVLPGTGSTAVFGSDLTVLVAGNPAADVVDLLDTVAEREARGAASSWRFTSASLRSALDAGHEVGDLLAGLREVAGKPLPQPVEYFVTDVGRRYGRVGVRPAGTVLVGEEALLTELVADSGLRRLHLRRVAPTVVVSASVPADVLDAVRRAGYLPREEDVDGSPVASPITLRRNVPAHEAPPGEQERAGRQAPATPTALALRLLAGSPPPGEEPVAELAATLRARTKRLTTSERRQLAHAVVHDRPVRLVYRGKHADEPVWLENPRFTGPTLLGEVAGSTRYFSTDRVLSVAPVAP